MLHVEYYPPSKTKIIIKSDFSTMRVSFTCKTCFEQKITLFILIIIDDKHELNCILPKYCPLIDTRALVP